MNLQLGLTIVTMELRKILSYRSDFWINFLGQTFFSLLVFYFIWKSIFDYQQITQLRGMNLNYLLLHYISTPLILRILQGENIGHLSREIYEGSLNKYLLYPLNYFYFKLLTYVAHSFFYSIQLMIIIFLFYFITNDSTLPTINLSQIIQFSFLLLLATVLYFLISSLIELLSFWMENIWSLSVLLRFVVGFLGGALIPIQLFPSWFVSLIEYTPFPYLINYPLNILLGNSPTSMGLLLVNILSWISGLVILNFILWKKGTLQYSGVGI